MKKIFAVLAVLIISFGCVFAKDPPIPEGASFLFDGFEKGNYWIWAGFDWDQYDSIKNSTGANISKDWASEGSHSLEMTMDVMDRKSEKSGIWFYDGTNDLSGARYLVMDFYNPENYTYIVNVVLQATDNWDWCSMETYNLTKGQHTFVFDMQPYADKLNDVRRIAIYNNSADILMKESHFYVDNIRLIK